MKLKWLPLLVALLLGGCILPPPHGHHPHAEPGPSHVSPQRGPGPGNSGCNPGHPC